MGCGPSRSTFRTPTRRQHRCQLCQAAQPPANGPAGTRLAFTTDTKSPHVVTRCHIGASLLTLPSYTLLHSHELPADEPKGLVEGVLPQKGVAILFGPSGSGKSFITLDLALCVATGRPWHGHPVEDGDVLYVVAEGGHAFRKRVEGWQQWYGVETIDRCRYILDAPDILGGHLGAIKKACIQANFHPRMVVIDTVKRTMLGDENTSRDVGAWDQACRTAFPDSCVIGVHHTGHAGDRARGSSAWRDHADTMFAVDKPAENQVSFVCHKQRDWDDSLKLQLRLDVAQLAPAPDGTLRSTLVVTMQGEPQPQLSTGCEAPELNAPRLAILRAFLDARPGMAFGQVGRLLNGPGGPFQGVAEHVIHGWMHGVWKGSKQ